MAPPYMPLGTQNDVPIATYIHLSKNHEGEKAIKALHIGNISERFCPIQPQWLVLPKGPFIIQYIFKGKVSGLINYFLKNILEAVLNLC